MEIHLDVLEASLEELYQGQQKLLRVDNSQEETESRIDKVEFQVDRLTKDTKDSVQHLHKVMVEFMSKIMLLIRTLNARGNNTCIALPQSLRAPEPHCYRVARNARSSRTLCSTWNSNSKLRGPILKKPKF